eukprot:1162135-Pelagomonas_calceolata.AAC.6
MSRQARYQASGQQHLFEMGILNCDPIDVQKEFRGEEEGGKSRHPEAAGIGQSDRLPISWHHPGKRRPG